MANLVVTIDGLQDPVLADQPIPDTTRVTNHGPDPATGVELERYLPSGFFAFSSAGGEVANGAELLTVPLDGDVDRADKHVFGSVLGRRSTSGGHLWYLDYHNNGRIWAEDLAMFLLRYGRHNRHS